MSTSFFAKATPIRLRDPLAETLGVTAPMFVYTYDDAVKLAGHSCPTIAGAFLIARHALRALYDDETPVRGGVEVTIGGRANEGVFGPIAQVLALITGAAPETGFGGLFGHFRRRDLLRFDPTLKGGFRFRRIDTGATVEIRYDPAKVPADPDLPGLLAATLANQASPEDRLRAGALWQKRVEDILLGDPGRVLTVMRG